MSSRLYKIRRFSNGKNNDGEAFSNYSLTVPPQIARTIPDGVQFSAELTDSGILYRPVETPEVTTPTWVEKFQEKKE